MATEVKRRRGTTAEHASFTGALGEVTVDTTKNTLVVHDNSQVGGYPLSRESALTAHDADSTKHFLEAAIDHGNILNSGTNTHAQIDAHVAAATAHGITGSVVGTTDIQVLTNKSIDCDNNTLTNIPETAFGANLTDLQKMWDGAALDNPAVTVTSDGATVSCNLEQSGGGDIRFVFSTGIVTIDCTPALSVALTAGTDTVPVLNFVYILESSGNLIASTAWPAAEHAPIATVLCQTATSVQADGAMKVHAWTDHSFNPTTQMGHLSHINYWIRQQEATWLEGVTPTITVDTATSPDSVYFSSISGTVLQLHDHNFPAFDTDPGGLADDIYCVNHPTTAYLKVTDFADITVDASGNTLANNDFFSLVVWGVVNEADADCKIMYNLSTASYGSQADAEEDASGFAVYEIPEEYRGVGFLISRFIFERGATNWDFLSSIDLRGKSPGNIAGGSGGSGSALTEFSDGLFRVNDNADATKQLAFEVGGITTGTLRIVTIQDVAGTMYVSGGTDIALADGGTGASDAATARTNLGVDVAGTDNSTDVTLAGTPNYLTIAGQVITRALIDLTSHITGLLGITNGGTGASTAAGARTALGVVIGTDVQAYDADTTKNDAINVFTQPQTSVTAADNDGSFDMSAATHFTWTPAAADQLTFTNITVGRSGTIKLVNPSAYAITINTAAVEAPTDAATEMSVAGTYIISWVVPNGETKALIEVSRALS